MVDKFYSQRDSITLLVREKKEPVKLIDRLIPKYHVIEKEFKIGKFTIRDQNELKGLANETSPDNQEANIKFIAEATMLLVKKENPKFNPKYDDLLGMMTEDTVEQVTEIIINAMSPEAKKKRLAAVSL